MKRDYDKALEYFELSAKQGNSYAQYNSGMMYDHGHGVKVNNEKAKEYYELSAVQGDSDGLKELQEIRLLRRAS